jgi:type VI secretion system protein ImpI
MYLTLEVIGPPAAAQGADGRRLVGPEGLTIGRSADNDWVLPDLYISKLHARITCRDRQFFIEGLGKNPLALGRADLLIPANQPQPLREGDRIFIDQYELLVAHIQDPEATAHVIDLESGPATERLKDADEPFAGLSGLVEPAMAREGPAEAGGAAPRRPAGASPGPDQAGPGPAARPAEIPHAPIARPANSPARVSASRAPRPAPENGGEGSRDLAGLLKAAGVPERDWTPELMQELGQVLLISIEGVMEMLRGRADIKASFQLPLTRVQARENNPLKLMPNAESVLNTLLVQRNPAYLPTVQAFEDAVADIRAHQAALLAGLQAAFEAMLTNFDPAQLQQEFDASGRRGFLGGTRYWEQYIERFEQLGGNQEDSFRRLCGEVFAHAYEQELLRLKNGKPA